MVSMTETRYIFFILNITHNGPVEFSRYSDSLWESISDVGEIFRPLPDQPGDRLPPLRDGYRVIPRGGGGKMAKAWH
jgi:hypothetical protein